MSFSLNPYLKAVFAGIGAGVGSLQLAIAANPPGTPVTLGEWLYVVGNTLGVAGVTWGVPNILKDGTRVGAVEQGGVVPAVVAAPAVEADGTRVG